jgi:cytochrome c5
MSDKPEPSIPGQEPSGTHEADAAHEVHEGPIKTPRQLVLTVIASFLVPIVVIILLVNFVDFGTKPAAGSNGLDAEAVARRIQPVASVEIRDASTPAAARTGEQVYQGQCSACHAIGAAGSPKFGDAAAWGPRIATGYDALLHSALNGKNAMPKQGGGEYADFEVGRAVVYMANHGGAKFDEPKAPEAAASAASAPN